MVGTAVAAAGRAGDVGDRRARVRYDREQLRRRAQLDAGVEVPVQATSAAQLRVSGCDGQTNTMAVQNSSQSTYAPIPEQYAHANVQHGDL